MQGEKETSRGTFKDVWDKSPPGCVFYSLSVDNVESLDNQLISVLNIGR